MVGLTKEYLQVKSFLKPKNRKNVNQKLALVVELRDDRYISMALVVELRDDGYISIFHFEVSFSLVLLDAFFFSSFFETEITAPTIRISRKQETKLLSTIH